MTIRPWSTYKGTMTSSSFPVLSNHKPKPLKVLKRKGIEFLFRLMKIYLGFLMENGASFFNFSFFKRLPAFTIVERAWVCDYRGSQ